MTFLNPLLKDIKGKTISLSQLSYITGVSINALIDVLIGKKGFGIKKSVLLRQILLQHGYDFPVECFLSTDALKYLNYILKEKCGVTLQPYNYDLS